MPTTLAQLLARPELALRLLTPTTADALDRAIPWVHSSELPDPTPFLSDGQVLLITGTPDEVDPYVSRLVAHGIAGLGFGTEVVRDGTPDALVDACIRHGLPLFEVPYRTPFIAIARFVADRAAADAYARSTWALRASRAISLAALRPDALGAVLAELARQLGHPVALVATSGAVDRVFPDHALDGAARDDLAAAAEPLLRARRRAGSTVVLSGRPFALQTLGAAGRLRGVLAVGGVDDLDQAAQQVVTGVVALGGLALEQSRATDAARARLRTAVWRALRGGDRELAADIAEPLFGPLPSGPVRIALLTGSAVEAAVERLELTPAPFFARDGDTIAFLLPVDAPPSDTVPLADLAARFDLRGGVSAPVLLPELPTGVGQASAARERATGDAPVRAFDDLASAGMLDLLQSGDARAVAAATVAPLFAADPTLPAALRVWLDHNGVYDVAARELGIHRHTLRARVTEAERLLTRDLSTFAARADLYAALRTI
ncbi:PucR family transcriptional regulator [Leifsonia poae]|uniref:PucR family transcriptional regulator n=1 Tax=Leifsonia poae TaxID=110933 RepID=UPI001CBC0426|nr:PucR family transcriptional regulator [Leifsonia poae]